MHILYVWPYWQYPEVALEFLQRMRKRNHRITVFLSRSSQLGGMNRVDKGIELAFIPSVDVGSIIAKTPYPIFRDLSRYMRMVDPDVVHVNSHLFFGCYQAVSAAASLGIPSVITVHGFSAERGIVMDAVQRAYFRTIAKSIFEKVASVICLTQSDAVSVARLIGSSDKIFVVPNGVDTELFKPSSNKDSNLVVWVGRFVPEKGVEYLIKAARMVTHNRKNTRFLLVGNGPLKPRAMRLVREQDLDDVVSFAGPVGRSEVAEIMSRAAVFALPSLGEGMPLTLLEAMASEDAIVTTNVRGITEIISNRVNGILVPPRNVEKLAFSILLLLHDDGLRLKLTRNAKKTSEKKYSWNTVLTHLDSIYESILVKN